MSKPTTKEMVNETRIAFSEYRQWNWSSEKKERHEIIEDAICALILASDKGSEVDEEFLQRWEDNFATDIGEVGSPEFVGPNKKGLAKMLREAGVRVREGK